MPLFTVERGEVVARQGVIPFESASGKYLVCLDAAFQAVAPEALIAALDRAETIAVADVPWHRHGQPHRGDTVLAAIFALNRADVKAFGVAHCVDRVSGREGVIAVSLEALGRLRLNAADVSRVIPVGEPYSVGDLLANVSRGDVAEGTAYCGDEAFAVAAFPMGTQRDERRESEERESRIFGDFAGAQRVEREARRSSAPQTRETRGRLRR